MTLSKKKTFTQNVLTTLDRLCVIGIVITCVLMFLMMAMAIEYIP